MFAALCALTLTHTYVKGHEATYAVSVALIQDKMEISGNVTFKALDAKGAHQVSAPKLKITERGHTETESFSVAKLMLDELGLGGNFEYEETKLPLVVTMVAGYLPGTSLDKGMKFEVSDKLQSFFVIGTGRLVDADPKRATIQYEINLNPNGGEPGVLSVKSVFEVATGELVSAEGKLDIEGSAGPVSIKRIDR